MLCSQLLLTLFNLFFYSNLKLNDQTVILKGMYLDPLLNSVSGIRDGHFKQK